MFFAGGEVEMRIQNLSENVVLHARNQRPINGASILNKPNGGISEPRISVGDAAAAEIRHPGRPERPENQQDYNTEDILKFLARFRKMHTQALSTQESLAHERVLQLLQ